MKYSFTVPLEEPRSKSYIESYHVSYSRKLNRKITTLGRLKFDNLMCLEMDHEVIWYCERPLSEPLYVNGQTLNIKPSVYVVYADGTEAFQLVTTGSAESGMVDAFNLWGVSKNVNIELRGYREVYKGLFWMRNISYLFAKARRIKTRDPGADDAFLRYLSINGTMTLGSLFDAGRLSEPNGIDYIADLYYRGLICLNNLTDKQISYKTEVYCNGKKKT